MSTGDNLQHLQYMQIRANNEENKVVAGGGENTKNLTPVTPADMSGQAGSNQSNNPETSSTKKNTEPSTQVVSTHTTSEEEDIIVDVEDEIDILSHYHQQAKGVNTKRGSSDDGIHSRGSRSTSKCSSEVSCTSDSADEMKKNQNNTKQGQEKPEKDQTTGQSTASYHRKCL